MLIVVFKPMSFPLFFGGVSVSLGLACFTCSCLSELFFSLGKLFALGSLLLPLVPLSESLLVVVFESTSFSLFFGGLSQLFESPRR